MKKIFLAVLLLISAMAGAQSYRNDTATYGIYENRIKVKNALALPKKWLQLNTTDTSAQIFITPNGAPYAYTGGNSGQYLPFVMNAQADTFYLGATFDTTTRVLSLQRQSGGVTNVLIPRGGSVTGISSLTSSRSGNIVTLTGDNGSTVQYSVRDADSATQGTVTSISVNLPLSVTNSTSTPIITIDSTNTLYGYTTLFQNSKKLSIADTSTMLSNYRRKTTLILNSDLVNSTITIGSTTISLGDTSLSLGGMTNIDASTGTFTGLSILNGNGESNLKLGGSDYQWEVLRDYADNGAFKIIYTQGGNTYVKIYRSGEFTLSSLSGSGTRIVTAAPDGQLGTTILTSGTVTSVETNNGSGITGGTITSTGTLAIDTTTTISTKANVIALLLDKLNISDTAAMLRNHATYSETLSGKTISAAGNNITGLTNSNLSGSAAISNANLANSSININGSTVSLGGSTNITANTTNSLTMNNSGSGDASGTAFNGSVSKTISYNTIGASPLAGSSSLITTGALTSGSIANGFGSIDVGSNSISGGAGSFTTGNFSGNITSTATSMINGTGRGSVYQDIFRATNTTGDFLASVEGSTAGIRFSGSTPYASVIGSASTTDFQVATNDVVRTTWDKSTGAAKFTNTVTATVFIANSATDNGIDAIQSGGGSILSNLYRMEGVIQSSSATIDATASVWQDNSNGSTTYTLPNNSNLQGGLYMFIKTGTGNLTLSGTIVTKTGSSVGSLVLTSVDGLQQFWYNGTIWRQVN